MEKSLDDLLQDISVMPSDSWENFVNLNGWYAVVNTDGIIAYFANEADALRFRLNYINGILNPVS